MDKTLEISKWFINNRHHDYMHSFFSSRLYYLLLLSDKVHRILFDVRLFQEDYVEVMMPHIFKTLPTFHKEYYSKRRYRNIPYIYKEEYGLTDEELTTLEVTNGLFGNVPEVLLRDTYFIEKRLDIVRMNKEQLIE